MDSSVQPTRGHRSADTCGRPSKIDPTLPEALVIEHALAFLFDWDWAGAEAVRRRFLASSVGDFDPQFARALAVELWALGQTKEALQLARRTRELDTRSPYLAVLEADYLLRDNQFDAAIALYEYAIRVDPQNANALLRSRRGAAAAGTIRRGHRGPAPGACRGR